MGPGGAAAWEIRTRVAPMPCSLGPWDDQAMTRTVLIVDDHAPFRALASALLQMEGSRLWAKPRTRGRPWRRSGGCSRV
jgi:hypothetical protein